MNDSGDDGPRAPGEPDADGGADGADGGLSALERRILEIEGQWFRRAGSKDALVRQELGLSGVAYHQLLNRLLDRPEAVRFAPATVVRLRRRRERARRRPEPAPGRGTGQDGAAGVSD